MKTPVDHSFELQMNIYELFVCCFSLTENDVPILNRLFLPPLSHHQPIVGPSVDPSVKSVLRQI